MGWSFVCPKNPLEPEWVDGAGLYRCSTCNKRHRAVETGAPKMQPGIPAVTKDKVRKHFDWACCEWISSESQRKKIYDKMGLQRTSMAEYRRKWPTNTPRKVNSLISVPGEKDRRSTAERQQIQ